nr:hypothetical protein [Tanacetum cinerariifolium]
RSKKILRKSDHDGDDKDVDPSARLNQGKKTKRKRTKELESSKKTSTTKETSKGNALTKGSKFDKSVHAEESIAEPTEEHDLFKQPPRPPNLDPEWNTHQVIDNHPEQPWFNDMVYAEKGPLTFGKLLATPIDFSKFAMKRLKIDKLTKAHLVGLIYNLLKGTCQSSIELEYNMEECYKALSD